MVLAQTFFGRSEHNEPISADELLFLFCITQSCSVEYGTFLIANLEGIALSTEGPIHVGRTFTHIAYALGLLNQLSHLVPYCNFTLIDTDHCLDHDLVWRAYFKINEYKIIINNEVIHHFTLPNLERTSIHNMEN